MCLGDLGSCPLKMRIFFSSINKPNFRASVVVDRWEPALEGRYRLGEDGTNESGAFRFSERREECRDERLEEWRLP